MVRKKCNLPTSCPSGRKFDIQHSMSSKKGSFIYILLSDLRDLTANMMSEVCKDTEIEPILTPLPGEELQCRTWKNSNEARLDIRTRSFWERGQQAFLDLRVFGPNACRYRNNSPQQCHVMNEQEKKRAYRKNPSNRPSLHLHLWSFQLTAVWEESAKSFTRICHIWYLKSLLWVA